MKKNIIIIVLLNILAVNQIKACDICGCQLGGLSFGLLAGTKSHYLGLRYTRSSFDALIQYDSDLLEDTYSNDVFTRTELLGRYILSDKIQLHAIVPYIYNEMEGNTENLTYQGIGDPLVLVFYNVLDKTKEADMEVEAPTSKVSHTLFLGAGVKAPLGEFDRFEEGEVVNRNFQIGTGSIDFLLSANYTMAIKRWGLNTEVSYKINTRNPDEYRFGNQFNTSAYLFYSIPFTDGVISPFGGMYFETSEEHDDDGIRQFNTGGNATLATFGAQLNYKRFSFNVLYQNPIDQNYNSDSISQINAGDRISVGFLYHFKRKQKKKYGFQ